MEGFIILGGDSNLANAFAKLYPKETLRLTKSECDITDLKSIESALSKSDFKYVINCAAITDIEWCEKNSKECFLVNTNGPANVEKVCADLGKKLIQISSDYSLFPVNTYGKSKADMEALLNPKRSLIIRTSFYHENYRPIRNIVDDTPVEGFSNVYFNPISIYRLAEEVYQNKDSNGILNIFSSNKISKYDFLLLLCKVFNKNSALVSKTIYKHLEDKAERAFDTFTKSDIRIDLGEDLTLFKKYSHF